jgi:hypothetical protein
MFSASGSLVTTIQTYAKEKLCMVANLFYILQKYYPTKDAYFSKVDPYYDTSLLGLKACGSCVPST